MKNKIDNTTIFRTPDGRSYLVPFILVTSLFLLWGFAHGLLDVLNKHFQLTFTMTKAESGLVQFSTYIAYFLMAIPAGIFMKKYGYKKRHHSGFITFCNRSIFFYPGGTHALFYSVSDRVIHNCVRFMYSGNSSKSLLNGLRS